MGSKHQGRLEDDTRYIEMLIFTFARVQSRHDGIAAVTGWHFTAIHDVQR